MIINLVTGGTGFLGSHLIDHLIKKNQQVICIDNNSTGNIKNLKKWEDNERLKIIDHDIIDPIFIDVDRIWHFACPASPSTYKLDPINTAKTSFLGTLNMLELAEKLKVKIFHASTSEVYGNPKEHPQGESYWGFVNPIGERACYNESKRMAESLCLDFKRKFNTDVCIARIFNTYGPKMDPNDGRVISNFIVQALKSNPLTVYGSGKQTRSFCFVKDLISGIIKLMESNYYYPINLGNPQEIEINQLAKMIKDKINPELEILYEYLPLENDAPNRRMPDIKLAKEILNWEPNISIRDGLSRTIDWFKKNIDYE